VGTDGFYTPFNMVSNYRDPGKVNINTIGSDKVWNALLGGVPPQALGPTFGQLVVSRRGNETTPGNPSDPATWYQFDGNKPSIFGNPFRSQAAADLTPLPGTIDHPVDATLYRDGDSVGYAVDGWPLLAGQPPTTVTLKPYNNPLRNPYFYTESVGRLTNKLTTRSNVYAVWVTVGYFEVTPDATGNRTVYPDGYILGQELGADSGEIERHRAFYIIDRSIPVGFERGQNHNAEDCILLRRFIE
jgi:hypothetical protein